MFKKCLKNVYRSRNKDVARLNTIPATRNKDPAAKCGWIFVAWYYHATNIWPHFQKWPNFGISRDFKDFNDF